MLYSVPCDKTPEFPLMLERLGRCPGSGHYLHRLFKAPGSLVHWDSELVELSPLIPTPDSEVETPITQHIHCRGLLREPDRIMEGQDSHGGPQTQRGSHPRQIRQDRERGRHDAMP